MIMQLQGLCGIFDCLFVDWLKNVGVKPGVRCLHVIPITPTEL